jgi:AcrR family transcriptional regulator
MGNDLYIVKIMTERRTSYHHGDLQSALLDAGLAVLERDGLDALSLRAVARAAGVSHAAPYHHFADKTALLAAIAAHGFELLHEEITARGMDSPADRLRIAAVTYVGFAVENPELFRLMFSGAVSPHEAHPELQAAASRAYGHITTSLSDETAAIAAWSLVHGLAMLLLDAQIGGAIPSRSAAEKRARAVTQVFWDGLRRHA